MIKKSANPKLFCPQCGGVKQARSRKCAACSGHFKGRLRDLLTHFACGETFKEIALEFGVSVKTVEYHWAKAKAKFGLQCPQDAVFYALRHGWVNQNGTAVAKGDRVRY